MIAMKSERVAEFDEAAAPQIEGEIRELVRRDSSFWRRSRAESGADAVDSTNTLIQRVSGATVEEIDRVMSELTVVRDMLRSEGERVQREISGYAAFSKTAMASMKIIGDNLMQLKPASAGPIIRQAMD